MQTQKLVAEVKCENSKATSSLLLEQQTNESGNCILFFDRKKKEDQDGEGEENDEDDEEEDEDKNKEDGDGVKDDAVQLLT